MADKKISQLTSAVLPLAGTELVPVVQSGATVKVPVSGVITASTGYTPAGTGAVARSVASKLQESVSVKDFGAVGDGSTNDTAAIQAAVNSGSQTIVFPAGVYLLSVGIELPSNVTLTSDGQATCKAQNLFLENYADQPGLSTYSGGILKATAKQNITIQNLIIDGNYANQIPSVVSTNMRFVDCSNVVVRNCQSINSMMDSITFDGSTNCSVINTYTKNNRYSGVVSGISPNYVSQTTPDYAHQADYFTVTGSVSENDGLAGASAYSINGRYAVVEGNRIYRAGLTGITLGHITAAGTYSRAYIPAMDTAGSVVSNNVITEASYVSGLNGAGVIVAYCSSGLDVSNNVIESSYGVGISKSQTDTGVANQLNITSNVIRNSTLAGISIGGATNYVIANNNIINAVSAVLSPAGGSVGAGLAAIRILGTSIATLDNYGLICNNKILNTGSNVTANATLTTGISFANANYVTVEGNDIRDTRGTIATTYQTLGISIASSCTAIRLSDNAAIGNSHVTSGNGITITLDATAKTLTRSAGSFITDGYEVGNVVSASGFANSVNNAHYTISNVAALVLTYTTVNTTPVNETGTASAVSLYTSVWPYITISGANCAARRNRASLYPLEVVAFTLTTGATSHVLSNPNILGSLNSNVVLHPNSAGAGARYGSMYSTGYTSGSIQFVTAAAGVAGDKFFYSTY